MGKWWRPLVDDSGCQLLERHHQSVDVIFRAVHGHAGAQYAAGGGETQHLDCPRGVEVAIPYANATLAKRLR